MESDAISAGVKRSSQLSLIEKETEQEIFGFQTRKLKINLLKKIRANLNKSALISRKHEQMNLNDLFVLLPHTFRRMIKLSHPTFNVIETLMNGSSWLPFSHSH